MSLVHQIQAVVFDAFGTVAEIQDKRAPYRQLLQWAAQQGRIPQPHDAALLMSTPAGIAGAAHLLGVTPPFEILSRLEQDLYAELASIRLFADVQQTLDVLRAFGLKVGICSNLAMPYATVLPTLLASPIDTFVWSFEAGAIKPEPLIYQEISQRLRCLPKEILFVGDTPEADYYGPIRHGMRAILLDRHGRYASEHHIPKIQTLDAILRFLVESNG